ncbi:uncharacterized protein CLUP02_09177 [Colletotrichum lupini]|uniref:Uncharacterized protein n=1 Tax=Colletotrichum lupini TaxID=145971 RepID=A0A9Q8SVR3_9PEZI|nr:uncharacterized protein CLUP02_09177 [Colletotrichum lupini]UQC83681.1 hypothetical protein CLUP02_09177 [Colletotrichum lupini]
MSHRSTDRERQPADRAPVALERWETCLYNAGNNNFRESWIIVALARGLRRRRFEVIVGQARRLNCAVCLSAVPPSSTAKSDPSPGHLADNSTDHYSHLIIPGAQNDSHICQLRSKTSQSQLSCSEDYPKAGLLAARYNINREYTFRRMGANPDPSTACRKIISFTPTAPACPRLSFQVHLRPPRLSILPNGSASMASRPQGTRWFFCSESPQQWPLFFSESAIPSKALAPTTKTALPSAAQNSVEVLAVAVVLPPAKTVSHPAEWFGQGLWFSLQAIPCRRVAAVCLGSAASAPENEAVDRPLVPSVIAAPYDTFDSRKLDDILHRHNGLWPCFIDSMSKLSTKTHVQQDAQGCHGPTNSNRACCHWPNYKYDEDVSSGDKRIETSLIVTSTQRSTALITKLPSSMPTLVALFCFFI